MSGGGFFVFSFDGATGLRWQAQIPVQEALREYTLRTRTALSKDGEYGNLSAFARSAQDGSRTLWQ